ncbi:peptidylprolyl isomerase [Aestuariirhabdus haliotis]|uniref:peptidylprolyl isomerase n=1 Tax=Aestuariirhabdus haliotis TaxID=2918751 RepID=UPI00201B363E|nr:peptidylprolyl isomerase [Aestuariirhabdus haliotis]MCL6419165.1 peptidylprolyl isomerase [Aestuariirhabdus haliotis]
MRTIALGATLTLSSLTAHAQIEPLDRIAAIVNDDVVMYSELEQRISSVENQIRSRNGVMPPREILQSQVMERLIMESIQLQIGERSGIRIDDQTLNNTMQSIAKRNNMNLVEFKAAIEADGASYAEAREQVRRDLTINRIRQARVNDRIRISDQEVRNFELSEEGQYELSADYRLSHILIPLPDAASPEQIAQAKQTAGKLYQELLAGAEFEKMAITYSRGQSALDGGDLGWRKADQMPSLFASQITSLNVGEIARPIRSASGYHIVRLADKRGDNKMMQRQYDVRHILIKPNEIRRDEDARILLVQLYDRIADGESFEELARAHSDDTGSALEGGRLEWVNPNDLVSEFQQVMKSMPHGEVSQPFKTQYGWHILEVLGERNQDMSLAVKENRIRNILHNRKFNEEVELWLREIRDDTYVELKI